MEIVRVCVLPRTLVPGELFEFVCCPVGVMHYPFPWGIVRVCVLPRVAWCHEFPRGNRHLICTMHRFSAPLEHAILRLDRFQSGSKTGLLAPQQETSTVS